MSQENNGVGIAQPPVNILFGPLDVSKKDVWSIDIIRILDILIKILNQTDKKDLRVAGIAELSSAMIHRMKVESIFAHKKLPWKKSHSANEKRWTLKRLTCHIDTSLHILLH